jgi:protein gp37
MTGKKNIEYADESWNPFSGCLVEDCAVKERKGKCWAEKMAQRLKGRCGYDKIDPFKPSYHGEETKNLGYKTVKKINIPRHWKKPRRIDCCFMGDISFASEDVLDQILETIRLTQHHRYYILTKNPKALLKIQWPKNAWVGVTINRNKDLYRVDLLKRIRAKIRYLSIEPLYEKLDPDRLYQYFTDETGFIRWIIIGAQTKPELQPKTDWVDSILELNDHYSKIPIFMKNNLKYEPKRFEFPKGS